MADVPEADQPAAGGDNPVSFTDTNAETGATGKTASGRAKGGDKSSMTKTNTEKGKKKKGGKSKGATSESSKKDKKKGGKKKAKKEKKNKTAHFKKRGNPIFKILCMVFSAISLVALIGCLVCGILLASKAMAN